jgi:hypothetical protein
MIDPNVHVANMTRELADRIGGGNVKDSDIPIIAQEIIRKKRMQLKPEIAGHSKDGQMMLDAFGRKALVYPDGTVKEIG